MTQIDIQKILGANVSLERGVTLHNPVPFTRELSVDPETRTVNDLALTSEAAIFHSFPYGGSLYIILDHSPTSIRLDRLKSDGAVLWGHDPMDQIGAWYEPKIGRDKKLRANAKFSRGVRGEEKFQDVQDGICRSISTGFSIYDLTPEIDGQSGEQMEQNGTPVFRCFDWEPFEASLVSAPADLGAGVKRALNPEQILSATERNSTTTEERTMPNENENPTPANPASPAAPVVETRSAAEIAADTRLAAAKRVAEWGGVLGADAPLVAEYIRELPTTEAPSEEGLRAYLKAKQPDSTTIPTENPASAALRQGGGQPAGIELARSIPRAGVINAFDRGSKEENALAAYRLGCWALATIFRGYAKDRDDNPVNGGIFVKATRYAVENGLLDRALSEGVNPKGGYLVPDEVSNDIIDLTQKYGVFRRNANVVQMKSDSLYLPRFVSGPTVYFVNESQEITESDLNIDQVGVFAKKLAALVVWSSELDEDAVIDIGNMVADKSARAFAKREDECGFNGDGSATYGGMVGLGPALTALGAGTIGNVAGVQVGTGNAYSELLITDFIGLQARMVDYEGASEDRMKWYMSRGFYFNVAIKLMLASGGNSASDFEDRRGQRLLGYPVEFVNVLPSTEANSQFVAFFGDLYAAATMGVRRGFTFNESTEMRFKYDDIVGKATERFGITIHSIGNASATAADRLAGPIGGLIMAAA